MSVGQAKEVLGFPPDSNPSPQEVSKAYKQKTLEYHPDRGGDAKKMVELNVAKEVLDTGKARKDFKAPEVDAERLKDIALVEKARSQVVSLTKEVVDEIRKVTHSYLNDFGEYVVEDMGEMLDRVHGAVTSAAKKPKLPKVSKDLAVKYADAIHDLAGLTLRVSSRYKATHESMSGTYSVGQLERAMQAVRSLIPGVKEMIDKMRKLNVMGMQALPNDAEHPIPGYVSDAVFDAFGVMESHAKVWGDVGSKTFDAYKKQAEGILTSIQGILARYNIVVMPEWEDWDLPTDIDGYLAEMKKAKKKYASVEADLGRTAAERLARQFLRQ